MTSTHRASVPTTLRATASPPGLLTTARSPEKAAGTAEGTKGVRWPKDLQPPVAPLLGKLRPLAQRLRVGLQRARVWRSQPCPGLCPRKGKEGGAAGKGAGVSFPCAVGGRLSPTEAREAGCATRATSLHVLCLGTLPIPLLAQRRWEAVWTSALTGGRRVRGCSPEEELGELKRLEAVPLLGHRLWPHDMTLSRPLCISVWANQETRLNGMLLLPSSAVLDSKTGLTATETQDTHPS